MSVVVNRGGIVNMPRHRINYSPLYVTCPTTRIHTIKTRTLNATANARMFSNVKDSEHLKLYRVNAASK